MALAGEKVRQGSVEHISADSYEVLSVCGTGAYGRVLMVRSKLDGRIYAMKCVDKTNIVHKVSAPGARADGPGVVGDCGVTRKPHRRLCGYGEHRVLASAALRRPIAHVRRAAAGACVLDARLACLAGAQLDRASHRGERAAADDEQPVRRFAPLLLPGSGQPVHGPRLCGRGRPLRPH